jgi:Zn-dependent protease with chaperone function
MKKKRRVLKGLKAEHFMHPGDKMAIQALKGYKTFEKMMESFLLEGLEDDMYLMSLADNVKLGPKQAKKIHDMTIVASKILDMDTPALFMDTNPTPNAFAFGDKKSTITLTSGLIDTFSDAEIFTIIGHELGHIKCRHTLYSLMVQNINLLMQFFAFFSVIGIPLGIGFYYCLLAWYRRAELSADRAALLVTQSKKLVTKTMMKLAGGGTSRIIDTLSLESFLEQADEYEKIQKEMLDSEGNKKLAYIFGTLLQAASTTHPWPTIRTKEIIRFYEGERYKSILSLQYPEEEEKAGEWALASEGILPDIDYGDLKQDVKGMGKDLTGKVSSYLKEKLEKAAKDIEKKNKALEKNKNENEKTDI